MTPAPSAASDVPSRAPQHDAPREAWRPLSGMAVTAFVLSLVTVVPAFFGLWVSAAVPLVLGIVALVTIRPEERRGRGFAIAAVAIAAPTGVFAYAGHAQLRNLLGDIAADVLQDLRKGDKAALEAWLDDGAKADGAAARLLERYARVASEMGPYEGSVDVGGAWFGITTVAVAPKGVEEVGEPGRKSASDVQAGALWVEARFQKGVVHVALITRDAGNPTGMRDDLEQIGNRQPAPVLRDIRFFAER